MRKLVFIAAMSLIATQAFAAGPRSLSLAAASATEQTAQPGTAQPPSEPQPTVTATTAATPPASPPPPAATPVATSPEPQRSTASPKPKRHETTEARVIRALHRNGIYW